MLDLRTPRSLSELFSTAARLYRSHFLLFLGLAGILVIPFEIIDLTVTSPLQGSSLTAHQARVLLLLGLADLALIIPLVSAFQVQAVALLGDGESPTLFEVLRRSWSVMHTVVAASVIAALAFGAALLSAVVLGALALIPGFWVLLRLYVVAQTAAIERSDWPTSVRRGFELTRGSSWRVLALLVVVGVVNLLLTNVVTSITNSAGVAIQDVVTAAVVLVTQSFSALLGALLYFDLRARSVAAPPRQTF